MKKFFSFALVLAAVAMVSCGGNTNKKAAEAQAEEPATECTECNKNCEECEKAEECTCENAEEAPAEEAAPAEETK